MEAGEPGGSGVWEGFPVGWATAGAGSLERGPRHARGAHGARQPNGLEGRPGRHSEGSEGWRTEQAGAPASGGGRAPTRLWRRGATTLSRLAWGSEQGQTGGGMPQRSLYLAAYDISDAGRLRKALAVMKQFATGGQKSVFECFLTEAEKARLIAEMREVIDSREDRFFLIPIEMRSRVRTLGIAVAPEDPPFYYAG